MSDIDDVKVLEEALERARQKSERLGSTFKDAAQNFTNPLDLIIDKLDHMGDAGSGMGKVLAGVFGAVAISISKAVEQSRQLYTTLNSIKGINGNVGQLARAITSAATGSVSRQDIANFLQATDTLFYDAESMQSQLSNIQKMISAYGDVNTAVQKYQSILLLSEENQAAAISYVDKLARAMESTPEARLEAIKNDLQEIIVTIGTDLMYVLKPILAFVSALSTALRGIGQSTALSGTRVQQVQELTELTEQEKRAMEELNRLEKGAFASSLDEIHETGIGTIFGGSASGGDSVLGMTAQAIDETNDSFKGLQETFTKVAGILAEVIQSFIDIASVAGPAFLEILGPILEVVSAVVKFLDATGLLKPAIIGLGMVMAALAVQKTLATAATIKLAAAATASVAPLTAEAVAQGAVATAATAAAGAKTFGTAVPVILAAVAAGVAGLTALGIMGAGSDPSAVSTPSNSYSGTARESQAPQVNVYLDGKKVNDELANQDWLETEVVIG